MEDNKMDELELLLDNKEIHKQHYINGKTNEIIANTTRQRSDRGCSCLDFIKMVQKVVKLDLARYNIEFNSDRFKYRVTDPQIELENPIITYQTISRVPKDEIKPRVRDVVKDDTNNLAGDIYAQKFICTIQFNIFASVYDLAEEVMSNFENMMLKYTGYFKRNGVADIYFKEEVSDSHYDLFRQVVSVRNIRYNVYVENLYNNVGRIIDDVTINNVTDDETIKVYHELHEDKNLK